MGDFAILVYGGFSKFKALFYNFLSAVTAIIGALLGYYFTERIGDSLGFLLAFAAGGFIYIASCDLIPELHKEADLRKSTFSMLAFLIGISFMLLTKLIHH
jgi:zinc and cadmium transporter